MPKLTGDTVEINRTRIEDAALRCFLKKGFHGVTMRQIASSAGVSLGSIYNYFPDKLSLFRGVLRRQEAAFLDPGNPVMRYFADSRFPAELERLANAIRENVDRFSDYFKLIYVDVIEFDGVHIRELFSNMERKFSKALGPKRKTSFAATTVYLSFYQYFTLTRLFHAKNIYTEPSEARVIADLVKLFMSGIAA